MDDRLDRKSMPEPADIYESPVVTDLGTLQELTKGPGDPLVPDVLNQGGLSVS